VGSVDRASVRVGAVRRARGDVRAAVLLLLSEEPRNGYQLMQEIEERSDGQLAPEPLAPRTRHWPSSRDEGLVQATAVGTGREFALTGRRRTYVEEKPRDARRGRGRPPAAAIPKEGRELRDLIKQIATAAMQVMVAGTQAQREQAIELLAESRRGLYRILAQDDDASEE